MRLRLFVVSAMFLTSACFTPATEAPSPPDTTLVSEETQLCAAARTCKKSVDCCAGYFCDNGGYGPAKCAAARANGAYCFNDAQCRSKICESGSCVAKACTALSHSCTKDSECCGGTFCDDLTYGPARCRAPQANGSFCTENDQCQTHLCRSNLCASACVTLSHSCSADADCCAGAFCNNSGYAPWQCTAPQADGASCTAASQCQSGACQSGSCASPACSSVGTACTHSSECCVGSFCFNYTYAPSVCKGAQADGTYCREDAQCQSRSCRASMCAPATCVGNGDSCQGDTDCCTASYCKVSSPYLADPAVCAAAGSTGAYCNTNRQCVSHACAP